MTTCVIPSRHKHEADPGLLTCDIHLQQLSGWLHDIEHEFGQLDTRPSMAIDWNESRSGSLASQQAPALLDPAALTDRRRREGSFDELSRDDTMSTFGTLHHWAARVRAERLLAVPTITWIEHVPGTPPGPSCEQCSHETCGHSRWLRDRPAPLDVGTERLVLSHQLGWIATQPWVVQLYLQLRRLRDQLKAANGTSDPKSPGPCPTFDGEGNECAGRLWLAAPVHSSGTFLDAAPNAVQCDHAAEHRWEGVDLIRLSLMLEQAQ